MFGDMFEEAEGPVQGPLKENASKFEAPPPLRGETGFCGIKNQGATCYLNSIIQTLLLTPEFREQLFRLGPDELGKLDDVKMKNAKVRIIPIQLQMLLARLLLLDQYACGTEGLTESFGWVDNEEMQQHDVQELSRILFCAIEDSLVGTSGHDIIKNLFRGVIANTTTCLNCKKVSERPEEFLDLNIAIATQSTLSAVLHDMFIETELMSGKNQYHCDQCAKLTDARKGAVIKTLPPILTVSLLRFAFDYSTFRRFKEMRKFVFPLTLNMRQYCEIGKDRSGCYEYDLYSVIIHSGGAHGGHYHAYIRDVDGLGNVPHDYNPTPKKPPPMTSLSPEDDHLDDPLEAVAAILGRLGGENVPLNKLGDAFREESGTSWSKQYKRKYGTMIKFLRSNYETFAVDTRAKTVSFRSGISSYDQPSFDESTLSNYDSSFAELESGDSFSKKEECLQCNEQKEFEKAGGEGVTVDKLEKTVEEESDYHPLCNVWFDFNDSTAKAITTLDIETQFEGRESAYMLFYRRRDLKRPLVSLGNAVSSIPGHILAHIQKENSDLEHLRNEYDVYLNVVTIQVFLPSMFKFENGLIKLAEAENGTSEPGFSYSIDRRKTIADMYSDMLEMVEKHSETELLHCKEDLHCNILDVLGHGGFHIYEQVDKDKTTVISDSLLENDKKMILWNGAELQGRKVYPGKEFEAKILNVHCEIDGDSEISCVDYKGVSMGNVTIDNFRQYFLGKFQLKSVTSSTISVIEDTGSLLEISNYEAKIFDVVPASQGNLMLKIQLQEEDSRDYEEKNEEIVTLNISLTENFDEKLVGTGVCNTFNDVFTLTSMSCVVKVSSFIFVEHLKSKIPRWLYPQIQTKLELERLNLCMENEDTVGSLALSKLSLHEQQSLSSAGLTKTASVKLDVGEPLNKDLIHIAVCVQKSSKLKLPVKKCQFVKIDCIKTQSVSSFIEKVITELNLHKDAYHLRMLKSEKEVGDIITNPDAPIFKTLIHHGCAVILCPGCVSTEGRLRVPIFFYPNLLSFDDLRGRIRDDPILSPWCPFLDENEIRPLQAGYVSIDKDSTIFDLKQEVIELEFLITLGLVSSEEICLRSVSHKSPTKFHLQETAMIKRLRLGPTTPLAVSRISCVPHDGYTALRLSFNTPGTRIYANDCELQWEKTANLSQFPARLAEIFSIPSKEVLMARRGEEPWEWEVVKTRDADTKEKNTHKGKKSSKQKKVPNKSKTKKLSIKVSPQDGDILRIKRILPNIENAPDVTDFRSDDEMALYLKWQDSRQKESNMQPKAQAAEVDAGKKAKPKKEETLHIHVDKF